MKCFHHNDNDGRCAASIVSIIENNTNPNDFIELNYPEKFPLDLFEKDEKVYIVDISFSKNTKTQLESIMKKTKNLIWIDHHASSIDLIKENTEFGMIQGIRFDGTCGALLTYIYTHNKIDSFLDDKEIEVPDYLLYVDDHDCWKGNFPNSKYFFLATQSLDTSPLSSLWKDLYNGNIDIAKLENDGKVIWEYLQNTYKEIRKGGYEVNIEGAKAFVLNALGNSWVFGDIIKKYEFVVLWNYEDGKYCYSFYSDKETSNFDCCALAEKFGGGGHRNASGCSSKKLLFV